jgi:hypothetical protein
MANGQFPAPVTIQGAPIPMSPHETAASAVATQARAMVEARFTIALARPRDVSQFRARLLKDCERPGFADVAIYQLPRGGAIGQVRVARAWRDYAREEIATGEQCGAGSYVRDTGPPYRYATRCVRTVGHRGACRIERAS